MQVEIKQVHIKTEGVDFMMSQAAQPKNDNDGRRKADRETGTPRRMKATYLTDEHARYEHADDTAGPHGEGDHAPRRATGLRPVGRTGRQLQTLLPASPAPRPRRTPRHADLDVTLGIYVHTDHDAIREALDSIGWDDL